MFVWLPSCTAEDIWSYEFLYDDDSCSNDCFFIKIIILFIAFQWVSNSSFNFHYTKCYPFILTRLQLLFLGDKISSVVETVEHTLSPELVSEPSTKTFLYSDKTSAVVTYVH